MKYYLDVVEKPYILIFLFHMCTQSLAAGMAAILMASNMMMPNLFSSKRYISKPKYGWIMFTNKTSSEVAKVKAVHYVMGWGESLMVELYQ